MRPTRPVFVTNTLGQQLQEFHAIDPPRVRLYSCGPTVYQYAHIGNFRAYIFADTLRRMLEYNGYEVTHVRNITDVGHLTNDTLSTGADKIEATARKQNVTPSDIAEHYTRAFLEDAKRLNLRVPTFMPRATEYIQPMIALTQRLMDRGYAYQADGDVYYEVEKFPSYGALSGNTVEDLIGGARVEVGEEKKAPADFALWRGAGPDKIMRWQSPWGEGVPGWHIECSAMAMQLLGEELDIHTGGVDNIFPHHEDEIAESEAATGKRFVRYWMHSAWLMVAEGEKMSKSLGNIYTISELTERGFHPLSFRYFTFQAHYRKPLNFSWPALEAAQTALVRLWEGVAELVQTSEAEELTSEAAQYQSRFHQSINHDLDLPSAVAVVHDMMASRLSAGQKLTLIEDFDAVLGLDLSLTGKRLLETSETQRRLLDRRAEARQRKDWQQSDRLRDELAKLGLDVKDTPRGQHWVRRDLLPSGRGQLEDSTKGQSEDQPQDATEAKAEAAERRVGQKN